MGGAPIYNRFVRGETFEDVADSDETSHRIREGVARRRRTQVENDGAPILHPNTEPCGQTGPATKRKKPHGKFVVS